MHQAYALIAALILIALAVWYRSGPESNKRDFIVVAIIAALVALASTWS
jgi:hypothetical protein